MKRAIVVGAFLSSCFFPLVASADPQHGRLPDGRAYRIDSEGLRLVDQMAELEVTVDELKKHAASLEYELEQKEKTGTSLPPAARPTQPQLPGLTTSTDDRAALAACRQDLQAAQIQSRASQAAPGAPSPASCAAYSAPLQQEIERLSNELRQRPDAASVAAQDAQIRQLQALVNEQQEGVASVQDALEEKAKLASEANKSREDLRGMLGRVDSLTGELEQAKATASSTQEEKAELEKQIQSLQTALSREQEKVQAAEEKIEELASAQRSQSNSEARMRNVSDTRASLAEVNERPASGESTTDIAALKVRFQSELSDIQQLIMRRKTLLDAATARSHGVSVKIQPLFTQRGESLDTLRQHVADLSSYRDQTDVIQQGLVEIRELLNDDIAILGRIAQL